MTFRRVRLVIVVAAGVGLAHPSSAARKIDPWPPPSPYRTLGVTIDGPPLIDAVDVCLPQGGKDGLESQPAKASAAAENTETPGEVERSALGVGCAELELARLKLRTGFVPEARAHARRALDEFQKSNAPSRIRRAARFYRAESFYLSAAVEQAKRLYLELEQGDTPVALAARLRLADIAYVNSPDFDSFQNLVQLVERADERGMDVSMWAPRLAEWSLHQDISMALEWINQAPEALSDVDAAAVAIRRADLLYQMGEIDASRVVLRELSESGRTTSIRRLAVVRLIDLWKRIGESAQRQLERAAASVLPGLRTYARGVLARNHIAMGDLPAALEVLVRLVHDGPDLQFVPRLAAMFDEVVVGLTAKEDCESIVASVSGRRNLLMRNVTTPDPFLRLGDCYLELGLAQAALETHRNVAKVFGPGVVSRLTLRTARAEYQSGRLAPARAAARASVAQGAEPISGWRLLHGEILLGDDRPQEAVLTLEPEVLRIVQERDAGLVANRALLLCARAALRYRAPPALLELLRDALARSRISPGSVGWLAESALLVADLHRRAGDIGVARELYGPAFAALEPGPLHSRAGYWHGVLVGNESRAREIWSQIAGSDDVWGRLAANEIDLSHGRAATGAKPEVPESRRLVVVRGISK